MQKTVAVFAVAAMAGGAFAQSVNVNISGVTSERSQGDPANIVLLVNLGVPNAEVTGIDWNFSFLPIGSSWTAEAHMTYGDSGGSNAYDWDMGNWGGANNSLPVSLNGTDTTSFLVGGDGLLRIEFWEDFVNNNPIPDGIYDRGMLTIRYIPAPSSLALLGLGGLLAMGRRRR